MAVFTTLSLNDARAVAAAHGLGAPSGVTPIPAGSVNSNFFLEAGDQRWFLRIYEEQGPDGVAYEWALLDHLGGRGLPVPRRVAGPAPGVVQVAGKPVALFELIGGTMSCQRAVTPSRAAAIGRMLAQCHLATAEFPLRRQGRFTLTDVRRRLSQTAAGSRPELSGALASIGAALDEIEGGWPLDLPVGVVHGDLFRDNVHWEGDEIVAVIDWESASDGALVYDLAVTVLAWCFDAEMEWALARALVAGYGQVRSITSAEASAFRLAALAAASRFATTRITDFYLRQGIGERVYKDYKRFVTRLETVAALDAEELLRRLALQPAG